MQLKKILVPVDGSDHSMKAAECAMDLAKPMNSEIILLHCHRPFPSVLGDPLLQTAISKRLKKSTELLKPYRDFFLERNAHFSDMILEGPPGSVISEVAEIEKCDMIVMGSRGRTNLEGLILGSVAHRVLHTASCPVLVVK